jgi:nucleoside-diphosphate-sugar epimerase
VLTGGVTKAVVFGATGVVGRAAAEHLAELGWEVVGVSRRPHGLRGIKHVATDLGVDFADDPALAGVTHVVYAALQESRDLVAGWRDPALMQHNLTMFRHALEPVVRRGAGSLHHVTLLQGAKAYGLHVGRSPLPAKERWPRDSHDNFYFLQEDALRDLAEGGGWTWTILRPQVVYGESFGSPMNLLPAIGVYAAIERAAGRPLGFPGKEPSLQEAVDARLLARVIAWAGSSKAAARETFNVTNGDVFDWIEVWPRLAEALDVEAGDPLPQRLAESMPARAPEWAAIVDRHRLRSPRDMHAFVGDTWTYADILFGTLGGRPRPALLSTIKIRQAGFTDCVDSEDMLCEWLSHFRRCRLVP